MLIPVTQSAISRRELPENPVAVTMSFELPRAMPGTRQA